MARAQAVRESAPPSGAGPSKQPAAAAPTPSAAAAGTFLAPPAANRKDRLSASLRRAVAQRQRATQTGATGHELSPVRIVRNSAEPAHLGAEAMAYGDEIHFAPGVDGATTPHGRWLLAHELAHVVQQREGRVSPTTYVGGVPISTDPTLERAADAAAARMLSASGGATRDGTPAVAGSARAVAQLWPPNSVEEADQELADVQAELFVTGATIYTASQRQTRTQTETAYALPPPGTRGLKQELTERCDAITRASPMTGSRARFLIKRWLDLKKWKTDEFRRQSGFGYPTQPSSLFLEPGRFETTFTFTPFAPELHGVKFEDVPTGHTFEHLGSDLAVRHASQTELEEKRRKSKAYRRPGEKKAKPKTKAKRKREPDVPTPTFGATIFQDEVTTLDQERVKLWKHEKRGKKARIGPYEARNMNWPDQQAVLKMSAQDAVAAFKGEGGGPALDQTLPYEWLHLFAFSMGGQDALNPQDERNFVVGTQNANFYHLIFESIAKDLAETHGKRVRMRVTPAEPVSAKWRIYQTIRYEFAIVETVTTSSFFGGTQTFETFPRSVTRNIRCLEAPPVHAGDKDGLKELILAGLGLPSELYLKTLQDVHDRLVGPSPSQGLFGLLDERPRHEDRPMRFGFLEQEEGEPQLQAALEESVQDIARAHRVLDVYTVGHADGRDLNCSILSIFAAAGIRLSREQADRYRRQLVRLEHTGAFDDIDISDREFLNAALILGFLRDDYGRRVRLRVVRPVDPDYAESIVAGEGDEVITIFYASGHFSPAWPLRG